MAGAVGSAAESGGVLERRRKKPDEDNFSGNDPRHCALTMSRISRMC